MRAVASSKSTQAVHARQQLPSRCPLGGLADATAAGRMFIYICLAKLLHEPVPHGHIPMPMTAATRCGLAVPILAAMLMHGGLYD